MSIPRAIPYLRARRGYAGVLALAIASSSLAACTDPTNQTSGAGERAEDAEEAATSTRFEERSVVPLRDGWTEGQLALLESMTIDALPPPPEDPSNRVAQDPAAAALGQLLFFETKLSSNRQVACVSCHDPEQFFTDGRPVSIGVGVTNRNAPTVVGAAYSPWMFWDGRRDSLWAQALAPLESSAEMNVTRVEVVRHVADTPAAAALYLEAFGRPPIPPGIGQLPERAGPYGDPAARDAWARMTPAEREAIDRAFADVGKAIAAYQRLLVPGPGRFDRYVKALDQAPDEDDPTSALTPSELMGLRLFMDAGRTQCLRCHNGPLFTNQGFHRVGTEWTAEGMPEFGRFLGIQAVLVDPFNCLGAFSDAEPDSCRELRFMRRDHVDAEMGKFKTPTLRGLGKTAPYMHDGRLATLSAVIDHYRVPPPDGPPSPSGHELLPLTLSSEESEALAAFLATLDGGVDADPRWLRPPAQATGRSRADGS
jgi:cytochrome c peroxidase